MSPASDAQVRRLIVAALTLSLALLFFGHTEAWAQTLPSKAAQSSDNNGGACSVPFAGPLCDSVGGVIGRGVERVVAGGARAVLDELVSWVANGAGWLLGQLVGVIDAATKPQVTGEWFQASYRDMAAIAALGMLPFVLLAIVQAVIRMDLAQLLRSTLGFVPLAAIGTSMAVVVVDLVLTLTDDLRPGSAGRWALT